jgi:16S rRNA processing protein RimM
MGRILGPFGVKGWVKVKTFTQEAGRLADFPRWLVETDGAWSERAVEGFALHSRGPVAKLEGCEDREGALRLQGRDVGVTRHELGEAEEGSIYWADLVGLEVLDENGASLGRIEGLFESGATSVLVVRSAQRERLIPFVDEYVKSVDRDAQRITVHWKPDYDA